MHEYRLDIQLIEAAKQGDSRAFDVLVMRYQTRVFKIVARFVKDPSEIMDVCQEVFIKAYRALNKFRGDSSFYTWLYRIAINTSKNYIISQGRRLPDIDLEITDMERFVMRNSPKETGTPERLMMRDEIEHAVYDTIEHLPKDLRLAIMLREIEGLSYEEIADIMHCPVGTVRSRIFRARAAIDRNVLPFLQQ
jgi:RNA polymerase sigma-70 factor (ECF subfamily)